MYSELNEWNGSVKRQVLEYIIFMVIYVLGASIAELILNGRYQIVIDITCIIYFVVFIWWWSRYRFTKYRYKIENDVVKVYKVLGKSERLMLNIEKSDIHHLKLYEDKGQFAEYGPLMNYCVIDKIRPKYICALEFEGKKYRFIFQPSKAFLDLVEPKKTECDM